MDTVVKCNLSIMGPKFFISFTPAISRDNSNYWRESLLEVISSGIPEAETFGRNRKFSAFGFRFRPPKVKAEYGRNSRKALDFFFPSVFQDEVLMAWFSLSVF